jgi:tight adherence protein C
VNATGSIVVLTAVGIAGLLLMASGWLEPARSLRRVIDHIQRPGVVDGTRTESGSPLSDRSGGRVFHPLVGAVQRFPRLLPSEPQLRLCGRSLDQHVMALTVAMGAGFVGPALVLGVLQTIGVLDPGWFIPLVAAIGLAGLGPMIVHTATLERAARIRTDLRYQVSAYLDVVSMLLAGNAGYEGALEQAAHAGDGRLFFELRRRMRESAARGLSLTDALQRTGHELGLDELEQVAATAALSAAEGAPVARTLAAKCATLRTALATEQESEARLRTSRLTTPIVGMALVFMGLVIYPALSFS